MADQSQQQFRQSEVNAANVEDLQRFINFELLPLLRAWRLSYNLSAGPPVTVTEDTTVTPAAQVYFVDATGGNITMTLPPALTARMRYTFKKMDSTGNTVTVQRHSSDDNVEGGSSVVISSQWNFRTLASNEVSHWLVVGTG